MLRTRVANWVALQYDTYRVAKEERISFWELRRARKAARRWLRSLIRESGGG